MCWKAHETMFLGLFGMLMTRLTPTLMTLLANHHTIALKVVKFFSMGVLLLVRDNQKISLLK